MSGGGRRTQRHPAIFPDQQAELVRLAYDVWRKCSLAMVLLQVESDDYRTVAGFQATALDFAKAITQGEVDFARGTTTTPGDRMPGRPMDRDAEVERAIEACGGDARMAVRALLDLKQRFEAVRQLP
ncbi:hypothetical protein [Aureimonas pseudogalii]|uniref:Uncharacterized protein n=1 Tax=Aureimonas pseudogalii TaxID=1744844 RepID=A0A7W6EFD8_9HYPH|nr:hypothetical protein [Aureimonas pseudogalii]MBB3996854.1 hypothetical protein [Aureimonas pseudogalii]